MKICDICKKNVNELIKLQDKYKQDDISEICEACEKQINDLLFACLKAQNIQRNNFIRKFMKKLYSKNK